MRKILTGLVAAATMAGAVMATSGTAEARWGRGWGWGPGVLGGLAAGAVIGGALAAPYYYPYGPYGYYGPGCAWRTVWNGYRWVRVCY